MQTRRWLAGAGAGLLLLAGGVLAGPVATFAAGSPAPTTPSVTIGTSQTGTDAEGRQPAGVIGELGQAAAGAVDTDNVQAGGQSGHQVEQQGGPQDAGGQ